MVSLEGMLTATQPFLSRLSMVLLDVGMARTPETKLIMSAVEKRMMFCE